MNAWSSWVAGIALLLLAPAAAAETVYTWKDKQGVVHFSDENPEGVEGVETLQLEAPAPLVSDTGEGGEGGEAQLMVTPAGDEPPPPPPGPAEVVFQGAELQPVAPTQRRVLGRVRNVGGADARRIYVRIVVADGDTGNLCMTTDLAVAPQSLPSGETGTFEGNLDTPCFYGNPTLSYFPEWD